MVQSAYWEANSYPASQENSRILCNSKVRHRVHKSPPLLPILKQTNSVHALESCFINICFNIILHLRFGLSGWLSFTSLQQNSIYISHPIRATWCAHHITPDLIAAVVTGEDHKPCSSSWCRFLQYLVRSSSSHPHVFLSNVLIFGLRSEYEESWQSLRKVDGLSEYSKL